jgi:hypothetical protein
MATASEPTITLQELLELNELEREARGESADDMTRAFRARLAALRARKADGGIHEQPRREPLETRVAALEGEVKRLRELIESGRKDG